MKKLILSALTLTSFGLFAQPGQAQNNSFENWEVSAEFQTLLEWQTNAPEAEGLIVRDSASTEQEFSVLLETQDVNTVPTSALLAYMTPDGFALPYSSQVDSFYIDVQYELMAGDTATVAVVQIVNGNPQPIFNVALLAGSQPTWATLQMPMLSPSQDSIMIYVITENLVSGAEPIVGSWINVDNARFTHSTTAPAGLNNFSFEDWDIEQVIEPEFYATTNTILQENGFPPNVEEQTSGANDGTSFARLSGLDLIFFQVPGLLTNAEFDQNFDITTGAAYVARPDSCVGYYKGTVTAGDTATIGVEFFENGNLIDDTILIITQTANDWTKYTFTFDLTTTPDTMRFTAASGPSNGSVLDVDDYTFYGGDLGVEEQQEIEFSLYPNPTVDFVTIRSQERINEIVVYALNGTEVARYTASANFKMISVENLDAGTYLIEVQSGNSKVTQTLIKR